MLYLLIPFVALVLISLPLVPVYRGVVTGKKARYSIVFNICAFFGVCVLALALPLGGFAQAAAEASSVAATLSTGAGLGYLGAALVTGLSCVGAGIAVAAAAPAAIGACSEDPKTFGKSLIFVAMGEGIGIYGLLISILIINNIA